jgi:hypothetical protein
MTAPILVTRGERYREFDVFLITQGGEPEGGFSS